MVKQNISFLLGQSPQMLPDVGIEISAGGVGGLLSDTGKHRKLSWALKAPRDFVTM